MRPWSSRPTSPAKATKHLKPLALLIEGSIPPAPEQDTRPESEKEPWERPLGKRSVEIVGEAHDKKKVMRYLRLNSLVPELLDKIVEKKMGFMPAVEPSFTRPKNQRLIAVSIDREQASPCRTRESTRRKAGRLVLPPE